ncbi:MAG: long-chain fatty acid--CoA ligase [Fuerstiella sp.]|nr:long-chain fatty acid--CoA ligase [Fuerstiella sp.]MCP4508606.1 long-chain fatty acid--CoA ligase [Fuerstiella sp.]
MSVYDPMFTPKQHVCYDNSSSARMFCQSLADDDSSTMRVLPCHVPLVAKRGLCSRLGDNEDIDLNMAYGPLIENHLSARKLCVVETMDITAADNIIAFPPMSHAYGFGMSVMVPLLSGANILTTQRFTVQKLQKAMQDYVDRLIRSANALRVGGGP